MLGFRYTNFGECLNILRCRAFPTSTPYIQFLVVLKGIISLFSKYIEYLLKRCYPSPTYRGWENSTLYVKVKGKRVVFPKCPSCDTRYLVGRVNTYDLEKQQNIKAYYCSNCYTEFTGEGKTLVPLWLNKELSPIEFLNN